MLTSGITCPFNPQIVKTRSVFQKPRTYTWLVYGCNYCGLVELDNSARGIYLAETLEMARKNILL